MVITLLEKGDFAKWMGDHFKKMISIMPIEIKKLW